MTCYTAFRKTDGLKVNSFEFFAAICFNSNKKSNFAKNLIELSLWKHAA